MNADRDRRERNADPEALTESERAELRRLHKENAQQRMDMEILRTAAAWCCGKTDTAPAPDLLERDFTAERPDERWVADITEFATDDGTLHRAAIVDLHDRRWSAGRCTNAPPRIWSSTHS